MRLHASGIFNYWVNFTGENENGREYNIRCLIYADNGQKETRYDPGYPPTVELEEIYLIRGGSSVYLPRGHRFYGDEKLIIGEFYDEMEVREFQ